MFQVKIYEKDNTTLVNPPTGGILNDLLFDGGLVAVELSGEERFQFKANINDSHFQYLALSRILELSHTAKNFTKRFRIISMGDIQEGEVHGNEIICVGLKYDLANKVFDFHGRIFDQNATTHMTQLLSGTGFTVGTVTPTVQFTLEYSYDKILEALMRVREKVNEAGTQYDIKVNDNKSVDLVIVGDQLSSSTIEFRKNLQRSQFLDTRPQANRIWAIGGGSENGTPMTVRNAHFKITNISGSPPTVVHTLDSDEILLSNDSLNAYRVKSSTGTYTIIDSAKGGGNDTITVTGAIGSVGDFVQFLPTLASGKNNLNYIQDAASIVTDGIIEDTYRDETMFDIENLLRPAAKSTLSGTYTGGLCDGWTKVGNDVTTTENLDTDFIINGTKSQKVVVGAFSITPAAPTVAIEATQGVLSGSYTYKTCYVTKDGVGPLSTVSASISPANQVGSVALNDTQHTTRSDITAWQIYRKKSTDSDWYFLAQLDDFSATYYDNAEDSFFGDVHPGTTKAPGGQGIEAEFETELDKKYSCLVHLWIVSHGGGNYGRVRLEFESGEIIPGDANEKSMVATKAITTDSRFIIAIGGLTAKSLFNVGKLRVLAHEGEVAFHVDSACVVEGEVPPPIETFVAESAGAELWRSAYRYAQTKKERELTITAQVSDFYPVDTLNELQLGDSITVANTVLGRSEVARIVRHEFDMREPWKSQFAFSKAPFNLAKLLKDAKKIQDVIGKGTRKAVSNQINQIASMQKGIQIIEVT